MYTTSDLSFSGDFDLGGASGCFGFSLLCKPLQHPCKITIVNLKLAVLTTKPQNYT